MQCFICVTYMIILCSGNPTKPRDIDNKFSFVNNFIASLFNTQAPEEINDNEENKLTHNYDKFGYDNYHQLLNEADFLPRRNDRIAMPPLQYRFPKSMRHTSEDRVLDKPKEEVVIYINTNKSQKTENVKKDRPRPSNKNKIDNENDEENQVSPNLTPFANTMAGQSQIGDRESQTVVKPTVIVNIRGSVTNRDSDIRLDKKASEANDTDITRNLFNIKQEVNLNTEEQKKKVVNEVKSAKDNKTDEDMMMCESSSWKEEKNKERKLDNVMQILFTV